MEEKDMKYQSLIEELYNTDLQLAGISAARFDKITGEKIDEKVDAKVYEVTEQARKYGQNPGLADVAIEGYGRSLEDVKKVFDKGKNAMLIQNANFNKTEISNLQDARKIQLEIIEAKANGENIDERQEMLSGCKAIALSAAEGSNVSHQNIEQMANECNVYLDEIAENRELVLQQRPSKIAQAFTNIFAKFGGKKKFETNVINPLEEKTNDIKLNKLQVAEEKARQSLNEKIKNTFDKMAKKIDELGEKLSSKIKNIDVKKVVQALLLTATGVAVAFQIYSPVSFGLDVTTTVGGWLREKRKNKDIKIVGPAIG